MLGEVVRTAEFLAALTTFEWLVMCVQAAVVALQVFLAAETAGAKGADECLAGILGERLLASATVDGAVPIGWGAGVVGCFGGAVGRGVFIGGGLALACVGLILTIASTVHIGVV